MAPSAALTGVVAVVGFESSERAASAPAQPPPAVLPESLQRTDQLSKADFDAYVEESRSSFNPCFAKHSKVQQKGCPRDHDTQLWKAPLR